MEKGKDEEDEVRGKQDNGCMTHVKRCPLDRKTTH